jgi:DNA-binding MltR family transcriptional regulator
MAMKTRAGSTAAVKLLIILALTKRPESVFQDIQQEIQRVEEYRHSGTGYRHFIKHKQRVARRVSVANHPVTH